MSDICLYLDSLPNDTEFLNLSYFNLTTLPPSLSRFTNLKYFNCSHNQLKSLPPLNSYLHELYCDNNQLFNVPYLHSHLWFSCFDNPISDIFYSFEIPPRNDKLNKLMHFRKFYFLSKFKNQFIKWMWKSRELKIKERFHYKYLEEVIKNNENNSDFDLDDFIENWKM